MTTLRRRREEIFDGRQETGETLLVSSSTRRSRRPCSRRILCRRPKDAAYLWANTLVNTTRETLLVCPGERSETARNRGPGRMPRAICREEFKTNATSRGQVLTSCAHCFHDACLKVSNSFWRRYRKNVDVRVVDGVIGRLG